MITPCIGDCNIFFTKCKLFFTHICQKSASAHFRLTGNAVPGGKRQAPKIHLAFRRKLAGTP
ncbi:hypothetical protein B4135_0455 [Caldibacillus debilis]|uniref:Uncharacterized protein n=1 Tax=Caldibacillus debilis TaxID=301148 RepID=A0A150L8U5_9BACI|nr:hypothetical protein B4135_0455 [Caldibacillus debilis]